MTRVIHYICNIKIKDFLLCQYVIYGPRKKSIIDNYGVGPDLRLAEKCGGLYRLMEELLRFLELLYLLRPKGDKSKTQMNFKRNSILLNMRE